MIQALAALVPQPTVRCRNLTRRFGRAPDETVALAPLDLTLESGSFVALTGPSGCGKSTFLNLVGLLDEPSYGDLELCGTTVPVGFPTAVARLRRERVGFLFQDAGLIPAMSVLDNITMPLLYGRTPRSDAENAAKSALTDFGLEKLVYRRVELLSGGERQRVALIRALIKRPAVLVCDEPTASLDEANSRFVAGALADYAAGGALVLCSTHDPIVIERVTRHLGMARGRLEIDR